MNCPSITLMYSPTGPRQLDLRGGRRDRSAEGVEKRRESHTSLIFHPILHTSTQPRYWEETWLARLAFGLSKGGPRPRITGGNLTVLPENDGGITCYMLWQELPPQFPTVCTAGEPTTNTLWLSRTVSIRIWGYMKSNWIKTAALQPFSDIRDKARQ